MSRQQNKWFVKSKTPFLDILHQHIGGEIRVRSIGGGGRIDEGQANLGIPDLRPIAFFYHHIDLDAIGLCRAGGRCQPDCKVVSNLCHLGDSSKI
jgi:hypothetical protein